jgi:hypothetical protein
MRTQQKERKGNKYLVEEKKVKVSTYIIQGKQQTSNKTIPRDIMMN